MATENGRESSGSFSLKNRENGKRVCGLILVDDRISLKNNYSSRHPEYKNFITLGSVVIEKDSSSCEDLRKSISDQLRHNAPKCFLFLSKEGWPLLKNQESKLKIVNVVNDSNVIAIRKTFEKPRVGVVNCTGDSLGFIFVEYSSNLKLIRQPIDEMLKELMAKPMKIEYKFIERNGWPVSQTQENMLTVFDILVNQNITIKVRKIADPLCNGNVVAEAPETLALPAPDSAIYLSKAITSQCETDEGWKRPQKRSIIKRQTTRRFRLKASKTSAKLIMISYARQEAAQHALVLKRELLACGYTVYLDVDEIRTGTDWQDALNEAVSTCQVFVPLVTPLYGKTQWTNREVKLADILHKTIIPVNFLDQWPPECLAIQFATTQYVPWRPVNCENEVSVTDRNYDIKIWSEKYVKRVTKLIAEQMPSKIPKPPNTDMSDTFSPHQTRGCKISIVISAHPQQKNFVNEIKTALEVNFDVWCTVDEIDEFGVLDSLPNTPNNLPTIPEGSESIFSENYKAIARQIVESKRPTSLPLNEDKQAENRRLTRMMSQISNISQISSLTPDKKEKLKQFEVKVAAAKVVIVLASQEYFRSRTSRQHVYYCEHRKNMILLRCDNSTVPSWFSMLMADELPLTVNDSNYIESIKSRIKRVLDPSSKANDKEMQESKVIYLVNYMKKNLPVLDTCVYVIGSTKILDSRSEEICKAIGVELAKLKNVTLVTNGFNGASDTVARSFFEAKEKTEVPGNRASDVYQFQSSVVHILPLKDSKIINDKCRQNPDGSFEPLPYGQTLFLGESLKERETAVSRLLNTCILIGGGPEDAHEAQEFIWNDHYVIPVISTGGAASGQFGVPFKIFESPLGVQEEDRKNLSDMEADADQVAKSVVRIVVTVKKCIASYKTEVSNSNKSTKKSMKKKKPQEKLDVTCANTVSSMSNDTSDSPDKLPVVDIDLKSARKIKHAGKWKRVQKLITFSRKS